MTPSRVEAYALLTIDLSAVATNYRLLRARAAPAQCAAVVKADAYGLGIDDVVPALSRAGCETFFVAHVSEARRVRAVARAAKIYVLNSLPLGGAAALRTVDAVPVLGSLAEIARWRAGAGDAPFALHVDTGMNRLGVSMAEAADIARGGAAGIELVMSHFVSSEDMSDPANARQVAAFAKLRALFPRAKLSLSNSSGLFLEARPMLDLVRPGYALYGGNPTPGAPNPMRAVVKLEAPVIQLRLIEAGETVGYNSQWTARRRTRLATVSIGYADGFPRAAGGTDARREGAQGIVRGARCRIAGRVSMDLIVLDVTDAPRDVAPGDMAEFLGAEIGIDELAEHGGTIGYQVLTGLGARYAREYVGS